MFARLSLLLCALVLALAGCSQKSSTTYPQTDPPSGDVIEALVHGPVKSAFLDPLKASLELTTYDGSQNLEDFDMLILDGHTHSPTSLENDTLVQQASQSGMVVLAVDVSEAHKKAGLGGVLGMYSCGDSPTYAMRMTEDANRRPLVQVIESGSGVGKEREQGSALPALPSSASCDEQATRAFAKSEVDASAARAFADTLVGLVPAGGIRTAQAPPAPPNVQPGLLYVTYQFHNPQTWTADVDGGPTAGKQTASLNLVSTFTVFLQNENNPQGDYQYILVDINATGNPTNGTEEFLARRFIPSTNWTSDYSDWGFFQDYLGVAVVPKDSSLQVTDTSPETANGTTSVTTGVSFSVGFSGEDPEASYTYSNDTTKTIQDWKVTNESADLTSRWNYRTATPVDYDEDYVCHGNQPIYSGNCYLNQDPNDLSLSNMQLHTQAAYRTTSLVDGSMGFNVGASHSMAYLGCQVNGGLFCTEPFYSRPYHNIDQTYQIDLGTVIPIPIASLTFSPNPSVTPDPEQGNNKVTGTVTLSKPAKMNTHILISSNSQNATVGPNGVTIKQGETSGTFDILTNVNNIPVGGRKVATITAFYAQGFQAQLTVTN